MSPKTKQKYSDKLGANIKRIRMGKGLKVIDVARKTGLTSSTICQVERARISPTIATLKKIAAALEQPLSEFFGETEDTVPAVPPCASPVVHRSQRKTLSPGKGVTYHLLNPDFSGPIEFIYNVYEPGAGTGAGQYTHPGTECGLILEGELRITIRDQEYLLREGDSITFNSSEPHAKMNNGSVNCVCVWANTPPWF